MTNDEIITPKTDLLYNFGPASNRDSILFTCERPGGDLYSAEEKITREMAQPQITFMREQNIGHVLILLDGNEMEHYDEPGLTAWYQLAGIQVHRQPMGEPGASRRILELIDSMEKKENRIAAHCTHGMGRSGRVAAGWLVSRYGLSPEEATNEVVEVAMEKGIERMGNVSLLRAWLENDTLHE
jgi:protein-tyrosine phosphatase